MNFEIPDGLGDMLRDFTVAVLRERPEELYDFAVEYFSRVRDSKRLKKVPMYIIVDDDDDAKEPDPEDLRPMIQRTNRFARRHSVSAERYNPEEDDDDEHVVHPKSDEQRKRLTEAVSGILLFKSLDSDQMSNVIDAMFEHKVEAGEKVIEQGDDGDNFYIIDSGIYDVLVKMDTGQKKVHTFEHKGSFGELALMYNMPRSATVLAQTQGILWAMDRTSFRQIVLKSAFKKRKMYEELLESVPMLKSLDSYERMNVADALLPREFQEGDCIIRDGDDADGMYFLEDGSVHVFVTQNGAEKEVAVLNKGKYFGEMALVENKPRSANVYAASKVKLAFLERESFERLLGPCLDIMKRNIKTYAKSS